MLRQQWYQKMAVSIVNGLAAEACLLIFTLICQHSNANNIAAAASTAEAPNRRFEYKYSFKGPHLSQADGSIPFWVHSGNAIPSADQVRITPSLRSQKGSVWTKSTVNFDNWEAEVTFRVSGRGRMGADGLAIWFTTAQGLDGPVYGAADNWNGIGIFFDSFDNDGKKNNPAVLVVGNNGKLVYDHPNDGTTQALGTCLRDFRNKPYPVRAKITYYKRTLTVLINNGFTPDKDDYEFCTKVDNMVIPQEGYFGISAATGGLADDHDVLSFLTFRLSEPGQELPPPEAEMPKQDKDKYQEEFENFQQDLDKKKEDYQKEHPDVQGQPIEDMYESVNDREIRQVFEGQNRIHLEIKQLHHQLAVILDEQRRYVSVATDEISKRQGESGGQVGQAPSQEMGAVVATQQEVLRNLNELRMERDADFLHKKAERATLRVCLRDKYRLPKSEQDDNMLAMAGDDVDVPEELLKMVDEDATEEEDKDSILGGIQNLQNMDMDQLKEKASATVTEMKAKAEEKCSVM